MAVKSDTVHGAGVDIRSNVQDEMSQARDQLIDDQEFKNGAKSLKYQTGP